MTRMTLGGMCFLILMTFSLQAEETSAVKVMSFNIRYGTANDGDHVWDNRKEFVVETIQAFAPDLLGTQETLKFQKDYLAEHLPDFEVIGVGRDDGKESGEMMAVYVRKSRFEILDSGHFWYSETPHEPGSKAWETSLPRMATWVKLSDRTQSGKTIWFFNTHFDHRGKQARRESALLLRKMVSQLAGKDPAITTGDFNAAEGSDVYKNLFDGETPIPLTDTYRSSHSDSDENVGTSGGFTLKDRGTRRIDWIGCTNHFSIESAEIDRTNRNGVTPSDHFPVMAVLQLAQ
ncbi:endonuclease/exonuclease/phosphatase family protein [Thalassoglobus neptunius]|nr:endonuclease/exonuclease/phosphatase family protein [Thalassoglobus neptunius]